MKFTEEQKRKLISRLKNHKMTARELADLFKVTEREMLDILSSFPSEEMQIDAVTSKNKRGILYFINTTPQAGNVHIISEADEKERLMKFASISDTHFGSKYHLSDAFHEAMSRVEDWGYTCVYHSGDICDGLGVYKGQLMDLKVTSIEDQTDMVAEAFSRHPKLEFRGILGNHDLKYTEASGVRVGSLLEGKCDNFKDLGDIEADVIYHGIRIRLLHGFSGRSTYAKSYPVQTYLRNLFGGLEREVLTDLPHILLVGHHHTFVVMKDHGIYVIQPSSFQDPNNSFCKRQGLTGPNGVVLVNITYSNGQISDFDTQFFQPKSAYKERNRLAKGKIKVK